MNQQRTDAGTPPQKRRGLPYCDRCYVLHCLYMPHSCPALPLILRTTSLAYKHLELDLTCTSWGDFETGVRRVHEAFTDGAALPGFCRDAFAWAVQNGLVSGMDGALNASGTANRAQLATVLMHYDALNK